jgi:hypothetical protein
MASPDDIADKNKHRHHSNIDG